MPGKRCALVVVGVVAVLLAGFAGSATLAGAVPAPASSATPRTSATFYSPSRNISCQMIDSRSGVGAFVFCQSMNRPHTVRMGLDGRLKICRDASLATTHCLGNPGEHTPVLGYGRHITLTHLRCGSAQAGVTCTVIRTGKGFRIDRAGVRRVGA